MPDPDAPADPEYRERLWPGPAVWIVAFGTIAALGIAYGSSLGALTGWLVALVGGAVAALLIVRSAALVSVTDQRLCAGRARIDWEFTGRVLPLDADQARAARGPEGDPTAFMLLRPGVGPGAVVVEVTDPVDPHRTWLLASRHPQRLTRAIETARGRLLP
jgi:Protein of unknown function (DUF3093)